MRWALLPQPIYRWWDVEFDGYHANEYFFSRVLSVTPVTVDDLRKATMELTRSTPSAVARYVNLRTCIEYPELTRVDSGPNSYGVKKRIGPHTVQYFVNGEPVDRSREAIVAAINAYRATKADDDA